MTNSQLDRLINLEFHKRRNWLSQPVGYYKDKRWYPSKNEKQKCCNNINTLSLKTHCRTKRHIKNLLKQNRLTEIEDEIEHLYELDYPTKHLTTIALLTQEAIEITETL